MDTHIAAAKVQTLTAKERDVLFRHYYAQSTRHFKKKYVVQELAKRLFFDPKSPLHGVGEIEWN